MTQYSSIGAHIRQQRIQKHLTPKIVAHIAGISVSYYSRIERGECLPSLETFIKLMDILAFSADDALRLPLSQKGQVYDKKAFLPS